MCLAEEQSVSIMVFAETRESGQNQFGRGFEGAAS
jgi:hypothetical protein